LSLLLFFDENVDVNLAALLSQRGFDVLTTQAAGRANAGFSDESQLEFAAKEGRAIFTHNVRDFAPLAEAWASAGRHHAGIVVSEIRPPWELSTRMLSLQAMYPTGISDLFLRLPGLT